MPKISVENQAFACGSMHAKRRIEMHNNWDLTDNDVVDNLRKASIILSDKAKVKFREGYDQRINREVKRAQ